jgi:hypothetical protein
MLLFGNNVSSEGLGDDLAIFDDERVRTKVIDVVWRFSAPDDVSVVAFDRYVFHLEERARFA